MTLWRLVLQGAIFAQVEAFIERCRNLLEICEGQIQFARRSISNNGGAKAELPKFGGSRGPEIAQVSQLCIVLIAVVCWIS